MRVCCLSAEENATRVVHENARIGAAIGEHAVDGAIALLAADGRGVAVVLGRKDTDGQHSPDAAGTVHGERVEGVVDLELAHEAGRAWYMRGESERGT